MPSVSSETAAGPPTWSVRAVAAVQILFGAYVVVGSLGELLILTQPALWPPAVMAAYEQLHVSILLKAWVLLLNVGMFPLGIAFLVAGVGLLRRRPWATLVARQCGWVMLTLVVTSQLVLAVLLYPDLLSGALGVEEPRQWLLAMVLAGGGALVLPLMTLWIVRAQPPSHAGSG